RRTAVTRICREYGRPMSPASRVLAVGLSLVLAGCTGSSPARPSTTGRAPATGRPPPVPATAQPPAPVPSVAYDHVREQIVAYRKAHGGNGGKDWDITTKTAGQLAADPAAQE